MSAMSKRPILKTELQDPQAIAEQAKEDEWLARPDVCDGACPDCDCDESMGIVVPAWKKPTPLRVPLFDLASMHKPRSI